MAEDYKVTINDNIEVDKNLGKVTTSVPKPELNIGIDTKKEFIDDFIYYGENSQIDINQINRFTSLSQNRNQLYSLLDSMAEDPTIAAILETYAEDATEPNYQGQIVWCTADDPKVNKFVNFLLDSINVDKHIYKWVYSLIKYGDCYLRLYRQSDYYDDLFDDRANSKVKDRNFNVLNEDVNKLYNNIDEDVNYYSKENLDEDINIKIYSKNDKFVHYVEMVPNPAEMYELTKFGKSYAYIHAPSTTGIAKAQSQFINNSYYQYAFNKKDINIYEATEFVHASLEDDSSRTPEIVKIFRGKDDLDSGNDSLALSYNVKRGQSILTNAFKAWREMMLLKNSLLLNRITKSSIVRILNVEVGDMPKEQVGPHLQGIKQLIEQKMALNTNVSMNEYINPGPMENNIYVPVRNGQGSISTVQVGGDVDVKGLADVDYFNSSLFGSLKVPKQMFGFTEDGAGFNGGQSLSILSSRYAKTVKRIQNTVIQMLTDAINLMLLDKGLPSYVNKFTLNMQPPTTQEEIDRTENLSNRIRMITDILSLVAELPEDDAKLRILKSLISEVVTDPEILSIIQEQIDLLESQKESDTSDDDSDDSPLDDDFLGTETDNSPSKRSTSEDGSVISVTSNDTDNFEEPNISSEASSEASETSNDETILPMPSELGMDFTDNSAFQ